MDPVAKGAVWFFWAVASLMFTLCVIGGVKSGNGLAWNPLSWDIDSYVVIFLMILQAGVCSAGTADYLFVKHDLSARLNASTLGIVDRAMTARNANALKKAHDLADELIQRLPSWPWAYAFRGQLRAALHRSDEALRDFDKAIALRSDDPLARLARAEHRLSAGDAAGALEDLEALPSERQSENSILKLMGSALYKLGRRDEAVVAFERVVRKDPSDPAARAGRGEALTASDARSVAHGRTSIGALEVFVMEEGERIALSALSAVGRESLSREDVETAIQDFSFALAQAPSDRRLLRLRGDAYFRNGDLQAGEADYQAALDGADAKQRAIALRQRGLSRRRMGDGAGAIADYTASLNAEPSHQAYFYRALQYEQMGRIQEAHADIQVAVSLADGDDDYLSHRAALLAAIGDVVASGKAFRDVEIRFPANAHNYSLWLGALLERDAIVDALVLSARAVAACPDDPFLRLTSARVRSVNDQVDNALAEVAKALELGADGAQAAYLAAQVLADAGRLDEAEARVSAAADNASKYQHMALTTRVTIRRRMGKVDEALEDISRAIELNPSTAGMWVERACLRLEKSGATLDVLTDIEEALSLNPESVSALNHLSEYYLKSGDTPRALQVAQKAVDLHGIASSKRILAHGLFAARRWDEAAELLAELVRLNSRDTGSLWSLAAAHANAGRFAEAEAAFSALTQLDGTELDARAGLAVTVSQQHRSVEAIALFKSLREEFGPAAQDWIERRLFPDMLPEYDVVLADWEASRSTP